MYWSITVISLVLGLGLLYLTNIGFLFLGKPYIVRKSPALQPENPLVAFVNVNVVPMDQERILKEQTVIVRAGVIESIGDSGGIDVAGDALIVEGAGKYLMPGLADMHVHVKEENELLLFVANGVTTVRDMWGTTGMQLRLGFPDQLKLREQIAQGQLFGPTMYTAGPIMEGPPPTMPLMPVIETPEEAEESVAWQAAQGYDFVKVYDQLSVELGYLVQAGFTPYEAIEAGTRNAAEALGKLDEFGTVTVGQRADLILVEENPLEDVAHAGKRAGVMLRGHWLPEAQLREMLDELADSYTPSFIDRVWPISLIAVAACLILRRPFAA